MIEVHHFLRQPLTHQWSINNVSNGINHDILLNTYSVHRPIKNVQRFFSLLQHFGNIFYVNCLL